MIQQYNPRFATPDILDSIDKPDLLRLLRRYRKGLSGIDLTRPERLDVGELSTRIMAGTGLPGELVEAVCMIDELAKPKHEDRLCQFANQFRVAIGEDDIGHRLVVKLYLKAGNALRDLFMELESLSRRSCGRYMAMTTDLPRLTRATRKRMGSLEDALNANFKNRRRQQCDGVVRGHLFKVASGFRLIVRRGDLKRSVLTIDDDDGRKSNRLVYRRELYDVIRYDNRFGDLIIISRSKPDTRAYCYLIGDPSTPDADRRIRTPHDDAARAASPSRCNASAGSTPGHTCASAHSVFLHRHWSRWSLRKS